MEHLRILSVAWREGPTMRYAGVVNKVFAGGRPSSELFQEAWDEIQKEHGFEKAVVMHWSLTPETMDWDYEQEN